MSNAGFDALMKWIESAVDMDDCERQIMSSGIGDATRPHLDMVGVVGSSPIAPTNWIRHLRLLAPL